MTPEPTSERLWQTQASFLLEFQTRVVDEALEEQTHVVFKDSDEDETFSGMGGQPVQDWMLERYRSSGTVSTPDSTGEDSNDPEPVGQPADPVEQLIEEPGGDEGEEKSRAIAPPEEQTELDTQVESSSSAPAQTDSDQSLPEPALHLTTHVLKVQLIQPPRVGKPIVASKGSYSFPSPLLSKKLFDLEIFFEIPELDQLLLQTTIIYQVEGFAKSLDSRGHIVPLGNSEPAKLISYQTRYETRIETISLPHGLYRVELLIHFSGASIPFGFYAIPRFQVVQ